MNQADSGWDRVARARAGDADAFEELLAPVLDPALRLAITMLNDRSAGEDAVQEAALKAWRKLGQFRPGSEMRPWFLTIVANECRSSRRSAWWRVIRSGQPIASWPRRPEEEEVIDRLDLASALERLPKQHLLALTLYYHLDLPINEVARVLGCSRGAAKVRIHRALRALSPSLTMEPIR